jgi:hypothetical protein
VLLSPGIHSFPFKLGLPLGLPSTFLGRLISTFLGRLIFAFLGRPVTHSWVGSPTFRDRVINKNLNRFIFTGL